MMDFNDTPEEAEFRAEARAFLTANAEAKEPGKIFPVRYGQDGLLDVAKPWQAKKFDAGLAGITVPKEYGGRGGTQMQQVIYSQEEANFLTPRGIYEVGLGMCVPVLLAYGTEEQKQRYVPPALRGEEVWCQLFSEPSAGSDLANLRTRAVRDGDDWVINGQKIWTSGAHHADFGVIVTRSDPNVPKHKGLTYFFLDMKSPGIETRRIKQIAGTSNFNEVFFTDVRVPDSQRLGEVGDGWKVAITTLMNERVAVGDRAAPDFDDIFGLVRELALEDGPAVADPLVRDKLANWYIQMQGIKLTRFRTITALSRGERPGPESSINKVVNGTKRQQIAHFALDLMDMAGAVYDEDLMPMKALFQEAVLSSPRDRIAGGTDEILRNIIAERILGLPQDVRVDKDVPFNEVPGGG
jgi:alkylation response protein AidB-like acyl-CoA dehydrogenase